MEIKKVSARPSGPATGKARRRGRLALAGTALAVGAAVLAPAAPASASVGPCYSGIDSGTTNWAWGSCTGTTGNTEWRLHVSCTWGYTVYSNWIHGNSRVDVQCPSPGNVRATIIEQQG